jgi:hypothetical protein
VLTLKAALGYSADCNPGEFAMNHRIATALVAACALLAARAGLAAEGTEPGETWEITTSMEMAGMSMPPRTQQVCQPLKSDQPAVPKPDDGNCEMYDVQRTSNGMSWQMRCTGKDPATGTGEISYQGRDSYQGKMTMNMDGQTMTTRLAGKRLGAACDAGAVKKQIAAIEKQGAEAQAQQCRAAVKGMQVMFFDGSFALACDAKNKAEFCKRVGTEEGFDLLAVRDKSAATGAADLESAGKSCGLDIAATRDKLCKAAVGKDASLPFLARHCPTEAAPLAKAECAGRGFTSPPAEKYREFCSAYARHGLMQEGGDGAPADGAQKSSDGEQAKPESAKDTAIEEGKKALRKLLPF